MAANMVGKAPTTWALESSLKCQRKAHRFKLINQNQDSNPENISYIRDIIYIFQKKKKAPTACLPLRCEAQLRPRTNFPPDIWGDRIGSIPCNQKELELFDKKVQGLKNKVEAMLMNTPSDAVDKIKLIDLLCRLGVSYHFQAVIEEQLHWIFDSQPRLLEKQDYDLNTVSIVFRVLRQHGYKMASDVFKKFKDGDNCTFKESLTKDPEGMLNLFEATQLSTHGEDILDEALAFTVAHLQPLASQSNPHLADHILTSLKYPLQKSMPRLKAREYISFYEKDHDDQDPRSKMLLQFAKLDYNRVQLLHQQELKHIFEWRKDMDLAPKLPYGRDRIMEFFFWGTCEYYEPHFAYAREVYTKIGYLVTFLDDTYDSYGTIEELQILTDALQSWNRGVLDQLPRDYMKHLCKAFFDVFDELDNRATLEGRSFAVSALRDTVVELAKSYLQESQWTHDGYLPSFDESLQKVGMISGGGNFMPAMSLTGMGELAGIEAYEWLQNRPHIVKAAGIISRFCDDAGSYKREEESGYYTSPLSSYKREYKLSDVEAVEEIRKRISSEWKTLNEELMRLPRSVSMEILTRLLNFARTMEVTYKDGDGVTYGKHVEGFIKTLYLDPIPI